MTEFDRIKAMSVEEMAEYITEIIAKAYHECTKTMGFKYNVPEDLKKEIKNDIQQDLESEVKTNDT